MKHEEKKKQELDLGEWLDNIKPLNLTEEQRQRCEQQAFLLWEKEKELNARVTNLADQLGLAGFWRGYNAVKLILARELNLAKSGSSEQ